MKVKCVHYKVLIIAIIILIFPLIFNASEIVLKIVFNSGKYIGTFLRNIYELAF